MTEKINIHKEIFKILSGNELELSKKFLELNDFTLLQEIVGHILDINSYQISKKEIKESNVKKVKLKFKKDRVEYYVKEKKLFTDKYDKLDWEDHIIYLLKIMKNNPKYLIKENGRVLGRLHTKFEAKNAKRDAKKINEIFGEGKKVKIEKDY